MTKSKITKAIIPCGGKATRFAPISRTVPKEMLPINNKPVIHYIVEELAAAGITDILMLIGRGREALQNYFDAHPELESYLQRKNPLPTGSSGLQSSGAAKRGYAESEHLVERWHDERRRRRGGRAA